jgi:hypothetical protein
MENDKAEKKNNAGGRHVWKNNRNKNRKIANSTDQVWRSIQPGQHIFVRIVQGKEHKEIKLVKLSH